MMKTRNNTTEKVLGFISLVCFSLYSITAQAAAELAVEGNIPTKLEINHEVTYQIKNISQNTLTDVAIVAPELASGFETVSNTCQGYTTLHANDSCNYTLRFTHPIAYVSATQPAFAWNISVKYSLAGEVREAVIAAPPIQEVYQPLYVFGDSLSDMGNNGKSTNAEGNTWAYYVAQAFGNADIGASKNGGTDFARGGDTTANLILRQQAKNDEGDSIPLIIPSQFEFYQTALGDQVDPNALYVVWMGGNDFLWYTAEFKDDPANAEPRIQAGVKNIDSFLEKLNSLAMANAVTLNVVVISLPPMGNAPLFGPLEEGKIRLNYDVTQRNNLSLVAQNFNTQLENSLRTNETLSHIKWRMIDSYAPSQKLVDDFNHSTEVPKQACGFTNISNESKDWALHNQYYYWDNVHPTDGAHKYFAKQFMAAYNGTVHDCKQNPIH